MLVKVINQFVMEQKEGLLKLVFWLYLINNFSKSTRTDILKFLDMIISEPNLPKSGFEKNLMEENKISPSIISLFVAIIDDGKYRNERCSTKSWTTMK